MHQVLRNLEGRVNMSVFKKRNLLVAAATFVIGVGVFAAIWGVPGFMRRSTFIKSQVTAYLLDDRGEVNGLLLASGDQLHFSPQTGAIIGSQIKVGDEVTVSGHAGSQSSYGREVRVDQISANGRTIVEAEVGPPRLHEPNDKRGPRDRDAREARGGGSGPREVPDSPSQNAAQPPVTAPVGPAVGAEAKTAESNRAATGGQDVKPTENLAPVPSSAMDVFKAAATIRTHLVNGRGDVDGLILSSGEQVRFSSRVGELVVAAEQGASTQVSLEGNGVRNEHGTVIRPTQITVGNQTIALGR
jgi:hypothetical protein